VIKGRSGDMVSQLSWPFIGREDELEWVAAARREPACRGVVVSGAAGVGKTRLAREALAAALADGAASEWVQATAAAAAIPLGPFAGLVPVGAPADDRLHLFQLFAEALRDRATSQRLVLGVDDAHLLDPTSAALVLHLALNGTAFVVVTVRAGERCPDPIVALWKDLEVPRLELQQLSEDETADLLEVALEGELAASVVRWAFGTSEGHPLYLRELIKGAVASGALVQRGGLWQLGSRPEPSPALVDLISRSLEGLTGEELDTARLLALGEPLELDIVTRLGGLTSLSTLEARELAVVAPPAAPAGTTQVRLSHPLYGEVVRARTPILHATALRLRLAETVRADRLARPGDALRVATWLEEAGAPIDQPLLLAAAREANAAGDPDLAARLAQRAVDGGAGGTEAILILAHANVLRRRFAEAEDLLAGLEDAPLTGELAAAYLEERALRVLHLGLQRSGEALGLLARAQGWSADTGWRDRVDLLRSQLMLWSPGTGPAEAADALDRLLRQDALIPEVRRRAAIMNALTLGKLGRTADARAVSERLRPSVPLRDGDDAWALMAWWAPRHVAGCEWAETERWLLDADRTSARANDPLTRGELAVLIASSAIHRGKPVTATKRAREAIETLERTDTARRLPIAWLCLVTGTATRADPEAARAALAGYRRSIGGSSFPPLLRQETTALAALAVAEGETSRAVAMLLDAARSESSPLDQAHLLHGALRAGAAPQTIAPLLHAAAAACDAPLAASFARVATALAEGDGQALAREAQTLAEIGAWLWAAETAAQAAVAYAHAGRDDSARRAITLSARFYEECEGSLSPVLAAVQLAPAELTRRELEIVTLAAHGSSNAEIAERLVLSVRTVESHLYRAMRKLGVGTRQDLRAHQSH
jgi:DNA-binding CsgD family transcriptional regulator